jgi:hypothetical protein
MTTTRIRAVTQAPELLDEPAAASYISMSVAYLRADRSRGHVAGSTPGPAYLRLGRAIRYRRDDLDTWLAARRVDRSSRSLETAAA